MARDYSRLFDPRKRYRVVHEEQGAAQRDSDGNLYTLLRRLIDYIEASINAGKQWAGLRAERPPAVVAAVSSSSLTRSVSSLIPHQAWRHRPLKARTVD